MKKNNKGVALIFVIAIMAILLMMSMGLLLASNIVVKNAQNSKVQNQVKIMTTTLADQITDMITSSKSIPTELEDYVNQELKDGWLAGIEEKKTLDLSFTKEDHLETGIPDKSTLTLYWDDGKELSSKLLTAVLSCTYHGQSYQMTIVYSGTDEGIAPEVLMSWTKSGGGN